MQIFKITHFKLNKLFYFYSNWNHNIDNFTGDHGEYPCYVFPPYNPGIIEMLSHMLQNTFIIIFSHNAIK